MKRNFALDLTLDELFIINTALCSAYVAYGLDGKWLDATLSMEEAEKQAHQASKLLKRLDNELLSAFKKGKVQREVLRYASNISELER